jgi:hypothetical protein
MIVNEGRILIGKLEASGRELMFGSFAGACSNHHGSEPARVLASDFHVQATYEVEE